MLWLKNDLWFSLSCVFVKFICIETCGPVFMHELIVLQLS